MCGRFVAVSSPQLLVDRFGVDETAVVERAPDWNVTPRAMVPIVRERRARDDPERPPVRVLTEVRFGLVPSWADGPNVGDQLFNARAESIADKPAFRSAFRRRRCIVPADAFYEWKRTPPPPGGRKAARHPYLVHRRDGELLAFAGLWEIWRDPAVADDDAPGAWLRSCAIVTTRANAAVAPLHDRMPVVLDEADWGAWLDPAFADEAALAALLQPSPAEWFETYPVSPRVNTPANNDADLVVPVDPPPDDEAPTLL